MASLHHLAFNLVSFATYWVLVVPLAIPWVALGTRRVLARWWLLGLAAIFAWWVSPTYPRAILVVVAVTAALGTAVLWDVLAQARNSSDGWELALALWLLLALPALVYVHFPSKYLVTSAPAAAILVARAIEARNSRGARLLGWSVAAAGIALGCAILKADARFAGLARRAVTHLVVPQVAAGKRVWFAGHWGFQWYAARAGAHYLTSVPPYPARGDMLVTTLRSAPSPSADCYPNRLPIAGVGDRTPGGRILLPELGVGFFTNAGGVLPWAWSDQPVDHFVLSVINQSGPTAPRPKEAPALTTTVDRR